jgi:hypothetical protein
MPTVTWSQPSFAGGELAPSLAARVDHEKYHVGCKTLRNIFVHSHGGASNRSGTQYIASAISAASVLLPFQFSATDTYVLEFNNLVMRVIKNGALVESAPGVPLTVVTPYTSAQAASLKFTQSADTLYIFHPSYPPAKLVRAADGSWSLTTVAFADGPWGNENTGNTASAPPTPTTSAPETAAPTPDAGGSGGGTEGFDPDLGGAEGSGGNPGFGGDYEPGGGEGGEAEAESEAGGSGTGEG